MSNWKVVAGALGALAFFASGVGLSRLLEQKQPSQHRTGARDLLYLPTPQQARMMALGFNGVVADYYWVRALQYFTDPEEARNHYKNLADFLEVVLGVDPDYEYAYKFAGISIPYDTGRFQYANTARATRFLERGVERFPNNWQLHFYLGYNYLNYHHEPAKAAEQFAAASKLEGAPAYLAPFAARVFSVAGETERALEFAKAAYEGAEDPETKQLMAMRVYEVEVEIECRRIEAAAKAYQALHGRLPTLAELVATGFQAPREGFTLDEHGVAHSPNAGRLIIYTDDSSNMRGL